MGIVKFKIVFLILFLNLSYEQLLSQVKDSLGIICMIEPSAEFPSGQIEMHKFIQTNLRYPTKGSCIQGNVYINFCIEIDGSITNVKVIRGLSKEFDEEAVRVISIMPKWKPKLEYRTQKPMKSYYTVPCRFRLE
jgi:periplasmic protein TonB